MTVTHTTSALTPEVRSTPLVPHSLAGERIALANADKLEKASQNHAKNYDQAREDLGHNAVKQAGILAGPDNDRLATLRSLREEQSAATVASAESAINRSNARSLRVAFLAAAGGLMVNMPVGRASMIVMEPQQ